jgi:hypothetical protein
MPVEVSEGSFSKIRLANGLGDVLPNGESIVVGFGGAERSFASRIGQHTSSRICLSVCQF